MLLLALQALFLLCSYNLQSNQHPRSIQITIDASNKSQLDQKNHVDQKEIQTSLQSASITNNINQEQDQRRRYRPDELRAVNSLTSSVVKKTAACGAIYWMATTGAALNPWILPAVIGWRLLYACVSDNPIMDTTTEQEAQELAEKGKKRVSEVVIFPACYYLTRPSGK